MHTPTTKKAVPVRAPTRDVAAAIELILDENRRVLDGVEQNEIAWLAEALATNSANAIYVAGEGRSGMVARMAAMRLMHLGKRVYVLGETTTPPLQKDDMLIAFSGSGNTGGISLVANQAKKIGVQVVAITTQRDSALATVSDHMVILPAADKNDRSHENSQQFAGSLFEQSALLLFDALFHVTARAIGQEDQELWASHVNVE